MAKMERIQVRRSGRGSDFLPLFIILLALAGIAFMGATFWQKAQDASDPVRPPSSGPGDSLVLTGQSSSGSSGPQGSSSGSASQGSSSQGSSSSESSPPSSSSQPQGTPVYGQAVPLSGRVTSEYFDDAVFLGDSITTGLELYDILPESNIVAYTGINLENFLTNPCMDVGGSKVTILEAAKGYAPKKIYILLGANGLNVMTSERTVELYGKVVDAVKEQFPDATVYIQSIFPIEESLFATHYTGSLTNQKVEACNALLLKMAEEKGVHYLDVFSALKDATGGLPQTATSDGLHFKSDYYVKWVDYLKTHTVSED